MINIDQVNEELRNLIDKLIYISEAELEWNGSDLVLYLNWFQRDTLYPYKLFVLSEEVIQITSMLNSHGIQRTSMSYEHGGLLMKY